MHVAHHRLLLLRVGDLADDAHDDPDEHVHEREVGQEAVHHEQRRQRRRARLDLVDNLGGNSGLCWWCK